MNNKQYLAVHVGGGRAFNADFLKAAPELPNIEGGSSLFVFALY